MTDYHTPQPSTQDAARQQDRGDSIIPARRNDVTMLCVQTFVATLVGIGLRLLFVYRFPASAGDSELYLQLARNWADYHVYGLWLNGHLVATDLRMPGYPAFLAGVAATLGRSLKAILLSQSLLDIATCYLTAALATALAPPKARRVAWIAAIWLAATCPFVANYSAAVLTEVLVTVLSTAALLCFVHGLRAGPPYPSSVMNPGIRQAGISSLSSAAAGAFLTGIATLVRPEMPLLLIAAMAIYAFRWWRTVNFRKLALLGTVMAVAFLIPMLPWAARNLVSLHEAQILAPRFATLPDEYAPVGYYEWTRTWLDRYRDVYSFVWTIGEEPLAVEDLPPTAFDSLQERHVVAELIQRYNTSENLDISPELDREFAEVARQRTSRHPLRTYIDVPFQRALTIWFTPRTELLPIDGKIWPIREQWRDSHADVLTTLGFGALGYLYIILALGGAGLMLRARRGGNLVANTQFDLLETPSFWGVVLLLTYLVLRTIFLTTVEAPEPRYVVSCYPAVLALAALLFVERPLRIE